MGSADRAIRWIWYFALSFAAASPCAEEVPCQMGMGCRCVRSMSFPFRQARCAHRRSTATEYVSIEESRQSLSCYNYLGPSKPAACRLGFSDMAGSCDYTRLWLRCPSSGPSLCAARGEGPRPSSKRFAAWTSDFESPENPRKSLLGPSGQPCSFRRLMV